MNAVRLRNPPVVEVGLDFHFDPDPDKQPWDLPVAMPFVEQFQDSFPHVEVVRAEEIRVEKRSPQGLPERLSGKISLDHVKAHDEGERRRLEVGNDRMGYRLLRCGGQYPGFSSLLEQALPKLKRYVEHFRPTGIRRTALSYLDIVKIKMARDEGVELEDYFRLGIELPQDPFGLVGGFVLQLLLPKSPRADEIQLLFATEPSEQSGVLRFRMHWRSICDNIGTLEDEALCQRLRAAHEHLRKCFFASFTEKGLHLFDPIAPD